MPIDGDPLPEYNRRLQDRRELVARCSRREDQLAFLRLSVALIVAAVLALRFLWHSISGWWSAPIVILFFALVSFHERVTLARLRASRAVTFYEDGIARIEDRWIGRNPSTENPAGDQHLYAADLDLFGPASLFELICTARLKSGEHILASWLAEPATRPEIIERQEAAKELRLRLDLREDIAVLGSSIRSSIHPTMIADWGASPPILTSGGVRIFLPILAVIVAALIGLSNTMWPLFVLLEAAIGLFYRKRVRAAIEFAERPEKELEIISQLMARIEREDFASAKLVRLRASLNTSGIPPSRQIARLARLSDMLNWRRNLLFAPFSLLLFWTTQLAFAVEAWRKECGPALESWLKTVGEFEAMCSLSQYAYEHPNDPFPEIVENGPLFQGDDLRHPLMPADRCVANSVHLDGNHQLLVVSGSNMSGKSTLLRTVGVNTVLALAGAPVRARNLRVSALAIGATLRIQDSLQAGTSRFYAEIQRIHSIMIAAKGQPPVLFLLDEVLHGTNSRDRAVGAEAIVKGLIKRGAIGLVTTHDLALAKVADDLVPAASNVHFEDEMIGGKMIFDYHMRQGVVEKSNALELMRSVGLDL